MYCINERNPEFIALANKSVQPNDVLKAKISIWQEENNTDKFPTLKQLGIEERVTTLTNPTQQIENRIEQLRKEEQVEYDAMSNPNNKTKKDEIYNRYDKLITPLLEQKKSGIKPKVSELFESNPTLANSVYEAMGLNTINESDITYTDEEGNPCAKMGLTNTTKGTGWKIVKDFKGQPKHSQGGVDISISDKGVSMRRGGKDIKAAHGLLIPNNN